MARKKNDGDGAGRDFVPQELPRFVTTLAAPVGRPRHSATELMLYDRCARRPGFRYVVGVRVPAAGEGDLEDEG